MTEQKIFIPAMTGALVSIHPFWNDTNNDGTNTSSRCCRGNQKTAQYRNVILWVFYGANITPPTGSNKGYSMTTLFCHSEERWYDRFSMGIYAQMRDNVSQNSACTAEEMLTLLVM